MADPYIRQARGVFTGTAGSTDIPAGDMVYFDGTDWELADASDNTKYAEGIAVEAVSAGEVGVFCRSAIIIDIDAPYTQGDQYYLSETAGDLTATRPTTAGSLRQLVGFGVSTSEVYMDIPPVREHHMSYNFRSNQTDTNQQIDTGNFIAATMNADDEDAGATFVVPTNAVGIEWASLYTLFEAVTGATDFDITVSSAADGEQWDATTADSTLVSQTASGANPDEVHRVTCTTGFDATGIIQADNCIGFHAIYDGGQTDVGALLALEVVWLVV